MHVLSWKSTALQYFLHVCYKSPLHSTKIKMILKDNTCKVYLSLQPQKTAMKIMFRVIFKTKKTKTKSIHLMTCMIKRSRQDTLLYVPDD